MTRRAPGRFALTVLPPGLRLVLVRAVGYHALSVMLQFTAGETLGRDIGLEPMVVELDPIVVEGKPPPPPRGIGRDAFEERRRLGFGQFIDSTVIRRSEHLSLPDLLRRDTSVYINSSSGIGGGQALSSRYRHVVGAMQCS